MKLSSAFVCVSAVAFVSMGLPSFSYAGVYETLTESQKKIIHSGEQIQIFQDVPGEPWPKSWVYQRVQATPEEVAAVISDFAKQEEYVYRVKKSKPMRTSNPAIMIVDYTMELPAVISPFFDPNYRMQERTEFLGPDKGYQVTWNLVSAKSIRRLEGHALAEPLPGGATLISYENFLAPNSNNFILRSGPVLASVKRGGGKALQTIVTLVETQTKGDRTLLEKQIAELRKVFNPAASVE